MSPGGIGSVTGMCPSGLVRSWTSLGVVGKIGMSLGGVRRVWDVSLVSGYVHALKRNHWEPFHF